jgi:predicted DNA-binding protein (MmcQ/YjbR family)
MNIEELRTYCLRLPAVTEGVKWDADLCFMISGKMFAVVSLEAPSNVSFKVQDSEFDNLINTKDIVPAPYLARYKWVQIQNWDRFTETEWQTFLTGSYELIKSRLPNKILNTL